MLEKYKQAVKALPKGSLVAKKIRNGVFYYLAYRVGPRIRFEYLGKLSANRLANHKKKHGEAQARRLQYRKLISDLKNQIIFLKRALHERKRHSR
ncbi:MAG TPA: hypothetical protein DCM05_01255 [Elusimicrobia bacterium]|nr:hypothetical protein [Elusimicrobiota bacterium]